MFYIVSSRDTITNSFINTLCMLTFIEGEKMRQKIERSKCGVFFRRKGVDLQKGVKKKKMGEGGLVNWSKKLNLITSTAPQG